MTIYARTSHKQYRYNPPLQLSIENRFRMKYNAVGEYLKKHLHSIILFYLSLNLESMRKNSFFNCY